MAGAASALFILDMKGRVLIWRDYRGDVSSSQAERFFSNLLAKEVDEGFAFHKFSSKNLKNEMKLA
jgi:hypothetical protein